MSHTHISSFFHFLWSTKDRQNFIADSIKPRFYQYICGIVRTHGGSVLTLGGTENHVHLLCYTPETLSNSVLMNRVKTRSSAWLHQTFADCHLLKWETGYVSLGVSDSKIEEIKKFVKIQERYHQKHSYEDELLTILNQNNIEFHPDYFLSNTHSKQFFHIIWSTKERENIIIDSLQPELYNFIGTILRDPRIKLISVGGMSDHVHLLLDIPPVFAIADIVRNIKTESSLWLNKELSRTKKFCNSFSWQPGYGAFTVSSSLMPSVSNYILNQKEHHQMKSSETEWNEFIKRF